jgi:two-component system, sensor histidine kinase
MLSPEFLQSVLESAPDAIAISDACGSIVFVNRQLTTLFGYRKDEILGRSVDQLLPERFRARHAGHRGGFAQEPRLRPMGAGLELFARRNDGSEFPVEVSLSPLRNGADTQVIAAIRDVSDRRRIESELIAARHDADRTNLAKSRFLAMASHDLRQPVQTLSLLNGALRRLAADVHVIEALAQQEQAISAMSGLLNALLDIGKLEAGAIKPELRDFSIASIYEGLSGEFASLAQSRGLQLRVESCQDSVCSDPALVTQILRNLISNAIKYTSEGVVLLRCRHEPGHVSLDVLDTGIGIPESQLPYIYDEFFQVGVASNTTRNGYGLGLSIVSRLVKLLSLKLDVRSERHKGSLFSLELPASATPAQASAPAPTYSPFASRLERSRRILLVEDDAAVLDATRLLLKAEGYTVTTARSAAEARQKANESPPDLVISDYHLGPGETGDQVITSLRAQHGAGLKAILMTGDTSSTVRNLHIDANLRVVSKPVQAEQLLSLLNQLSAAGRPGE